MNYLSSKELRVEKAWNKRGLVGLRSDLLGLVDWWMNEVERMSDSDRRDNEYMNEAVLFVEKVSAIVWSTLPRREWSRGLAYISETCGLAGIDILLSDDFMKTVISVREMEEELREEMEDDFDV